MQTPQRIQHIDAWRLIAVALVIMSHVVQYSHPWYAAHIRPEIFPMFWRFGNFGVQLFFCISGFVICRGMLSEQRKTGTVSLKNFYVRRFLRIVPPVALYMLALAALSAAGLIQVHAMEFARAAAFVCNVNVNACGSYLAHTWSLAYEEQFYILFPFVFIGAALVGGRRAIVALLVGVMCLALGAKATSHNLLALFAATFGYMLTGCVAALYWDRVQPALNRLPVAAWCVLALTTTLFACVITLPLVLAYTFSVVIAPVCVCAMILGTPVSSRTVAAFFMHPAAAYLGKISFTIYLWQQLATLKPLGAPSATFVALATVMAVAVLSYRYFELPLIRLGHWYSARQTVSVRDRTLA